MSPTSEFMFFLETVKNKPVLGNKKLRKSKKRTVLSTLYMYVIITNTKKVNINFIREHFNNAPCSNANDDNYNLQNYSNMIKNKKP